MKFTCAFCDQHIDAPDELIGKEVNCPGCERLVLVRQPPKVKRPQITPPAPVVKESAYVKRTAQSCGWFAGLCFAIGIASICTVVLRIFPSGVEVAGAAFSLAFILLLLSQLFHIRAELLRANEQREK